MANRPASPSRALLQGIAGFLVWKLSPGGHHPQLVVGIFDQVALPGEPVPVRAKLEVANWTDDDVHDAGVFYLIRQTKGH